MANDNITATRDTDESLSSDSKTYIIQDGDNAWQIARSKLESSMPQDWRNLPDEQKNLGISAYVRAMVHENNMQITNDGKTLIHGRSLREGDVLTIPPLSKAYEVAARPAPIASRPVIAKPPAAYVEVQRPPAVHLPERTVTAPAKEAAPLAANEYRTNNGDSTWTIARTKLQESMPPAWQKLPTKERNLGILAFDRAIVQANNLEITQDGKTLINGRALRDGDTLKIPDPREVYQLASTPAEKPPAKAAVAPPEKPPAPAEVAKAPERPRGLAAVAPPAEKLPAPAAAAKVPEKPPAPAVVAKAPEKPPAPAVVAKAPEKPPAPAVAAKAPEKPLTSDQLIAMLKPPAVPPPEASTPEPSSPRNFVMFPQPTPFNTSRGTPTSKFEDAAPLPIDKVYPNFAELINQKSGEPNGVWDKAAPEAIDLASKHTAIENLQSGSQSKAGVEGLARFISKITGQQDLNVISAWDFRRRLEGNYWHEVPQSPDGIVELHPGDILIGKRDDFRAPDPDAAVRQTGPITRVVPDGVVAMYAGKLKGSDQDIMFDYYPGGKDLSYKDVPPSYRIEPILRMQANAEYFVDGHVQVIVLRYAGKLTTPVLSTATNPN